MPRGLAIPGGWGAKGSQFEKNNFTEMCSCSEAGSYLRLIDLVYHLTSGLRVLKKKKAQGIRARQRQGVSAGERERKREREKERGRERVVQG